MTNQDFLESIYLEGEEWRPVVGWEGRYVVSNLGRIVHLHRFVSNGIGFREIPPKLCHITKRHGYSVVNLTANDSTTRIFIHRAVAMAFIPNPDNKPHIDHIDGNPSNNIVSNLRWATPKENCNNPISLARLKNTRLKWANPIVRVKDGVIVEYFPSIKHARRAGYNEQTIRRSLAGEPLPTKDYVWKYASSLYLLSTMSKNSLDEDGE